MGNREVPHAFRRRGLEGRHGFRSPISWRTLADGERCSLVRERARELERLLARRDRPGRPLLVDGARIRPITGPGGRPSSSPRTSGSSGSRRPSCLDEHRQLKIRRPMKTSASIAQGSVARRSGGSSRGRSSQVAAHEGASASSDAGRSRSESGPSPRPKTAVRRKAAGKLRVVAMASSESVSVWVSFSSLEPRRLSRSPSSVEPPKAGKERRSSSARMRSPAGRSTRPRVRERAAASVVHARSRARPRGGPRAGGEAGSSAKTTVGDRADVRASRSLSPPCGSTAPPRPTGTRSR